MAYSIYDPKKGRARIFFRYAKQQFNRTIKVASQREADRVRALVEETLQDLERGKLTTPPDADPVAFMLSGGKVARGPERIPRNPWVLESGACLASRLSPLTRLHYSTRVRDAFSARAWRVAGEARCEARRDGT